MSSASADNHLANLAVKGKPEVKKPRLYKVVMLNDDYTPMDFVVLVLRDYFHKGEAEAQRIMLNVHEKGAGICGIFSYEIAETKAVQVMELAKKYEHPLQLTLERE